MILKHLTALCASLILTSSAIPRLDCNTDALAELSTERAEIVARIARGGNYVQMLVDWDNTNGQLVDYLNRSIRACFQ